MTILVLTSPRHFALMLPVLLSYFFLSSSMRPLFLHEDSQKMLENHFSPVPLDFSGNGTW